MARIRSIWISVSFALSEYELLSLLPVSFGAILLRRFLRSSNILSDAQSVSSIFSLWLVSKAAAVNEWPVCASVSLHVGGLDVLQNAAAVRTVVGNLVAEAAGVRDIAQHAFCNLGFGFNVCRNGFAFARTLLG